MENIDLTTAQPEKEIIDDEEMIFDTLIKGEIIEAFVADMEDSGFEKEEIDEFLMELEKVDEKSIKGILSMPEELRKRNFPVFKRKIDEGKMSIQSMIDNMKEVSQKNGFTIGYHTSKVDIPKEGEKWEIKATELDDRDDRKMAYYSLDRKSLYRADRGTNLYVVRSEIGENSSHKRDGKNNWGRANSLSIICKVELPEIDLKIEEELKKLKEKNNGGEA